MALYTNRDGQSITTVQEVGRGGEGIIYTVAGRPDFVAKIYHPTLRTAARAAKLTAMLRQPPADDGRTLTPPHVSLAWPTDLLFADGAFAGFLMPRIERSPNLVALFNPLLRRQRYPHADQRFLYRSGRNLATVMAALHSRGHVVGDLNQKNILVKPNALVTLVDTDSFQISDGNGHCYHCAVGVPDYTPPELQGQALVTIARQAYHDAFGLSVLLFQLLMEGYHPFTGRPLTAALRDMDQLSLHCLQQGWFPYSNNRAVQPPPAAPLFTWLSPEIRRLFLQSFLVGYTEPARRPTALAWMQALARAEDKLVQCGRQREHWYSNHLDHCPLCERAATVVAVKPVVSQPSLPPRPLSAPVATPALTAASGVGVPGCVAALIKLVGGLFLIQVILFLWNSGYWPLGIILVFFVLRIPQLPQKITQWTQASCRWLWHTGNTRGRQLQAAYWWLAPRLRQAGRTCMAYWRGTPSLVKQLAPVLLLVAFMAAISYFGDHFSAGYQPPPSPLVASPLVQPTPIVVGPR